jgi:hypothetical protein
MWETVCRSIDGIITTVTTLLESGRSMNATALAFLGGHRPSRLRASIPFVAMPDYLWRRAIACYSGYLFTYWHTKKADERKANIERINEQLRELYGPLLACITATQSTYEAMVMSAPVEEGPSRTKEMAFRDAVQEDPKGPSAEAYRFVFRNHFIAC